MGKHVFCTQLKWVFCHEKGLITTQTYQYLTYCYNGLWYLNLYEHFNTICHYLLYKLLYTVLLLLSCFYALRNDLDLWPMAYPVHQDWSNHLTICTYITLAPISTWESPMAIHNCVIFLISWKEQGMCCYWPCDVWILSILLVDSEHITGRLWARDGWILSTWRVDSEHVMGRFYTTARFYSTFRAGISHHREYLLQQWTHNIWLIKINVFHAACSNKLWPPDSFLCVSVTLTMMWWSVTRRN